MIPGSWTGTDWGPDFVTRCPNFDWSSLSYFPIGTDWWRLIPSLLILSFCPILIGHFDSLGSWLVLCSWWLLIGHFWSADSRCFSFVHAGFYRLIWAAVSLMSPCPGRFLIGVAQESPTPRLWPDAGCSSIWNWATEVVGKCVCVHACKVAHMCVHEIIPFPPATATSATSTSLLSRKGWRPLYNRPSCYGRGQTHFPVKHQDICSPDHSH